MDLSSPDLLFEQPICINNKKVRWLELKDSYGRAEGLIFKNIKMQVKKYTSLYGPGALMFKYGFSELLKEKLKATLVLDAEHLFYDTSLQYDPSLPNNLNSSQVAPVLLPSALRSSHRIVRCSLCRLTTCPSCTCFTTDHLYVCTACCTRKSKKELFPFLIQSKQEPLKASKVVNDSPPSQVNNKRKKKTTKPLKKAKIHESHKFSWRNFGRVIALANTSVTRPFGGRKLCIAVPRCVQWGKGRLIALGTKARDSPATCANCGRPHTANYHGCKYYPRKSVR
ncbi:uncharacterized protein LOC135145337 [Zophobas morio]|uniref:uncharacterized protein LOC135145337 n=1 Tax=Zophobas morio TaxID=2755281 RepID=UPI0030829214